VTELTEERRRHVTSLLSGVADAVIREAMRRGHRTSTEELTLAGLQVAIALVEGHGDRDEDWLERLLG
jgi:hypothetical protein